MPMCEQCGQHPDTVLIKQIVDGKMSEHYLCSACAQAQGFGSGLFTMNDMGKMLASLMGQGVSSPSRIRRGQFRCESCGFDLADFETTARLGCPDCYDAFRTQLDSVIRRVQGGNVKHHGSIPDTPAQKQAPSSEIEILRAQLQKAIENEAYEEAATLRDKIRELEKGDNA